MANEKTLLRIKTCNTYVGVHQPLTIAHLKWYFVPGLVSGYYFLR